MNEQNQNKYIIDFKTKLEITANKEFLIHNEINQIESFTSKAEVRGLFLDSHRHNTTKTNSVFDLSDIGNSGLFNRIFTEYLINGEYVLDKNSISFSSRKSIYEQALKFAEYYKWLKSLQTNPSDKTKKSQLTHKQKMLALHYLGLDLSKYDNTKSAKILSQILELSEENTRKYISYLSAGKNNVRTKSNLQTLFQLFEQQEFRDISNQISNDIKKM